MTFQMITRKIPLLSHNEVYHRRTIKFPNEHTQINGRVAPYLTNIISGATYLPTYQPTIFKHKMPTLLGLSYWPLAGLMS